MDELKIIKTMIATGQFQKCPECGGTDIRSDRCRRCGYFFSRHCEVREEKPQKKVKSDLIHVGVKGTNPSPNKTRVYAVCCGLFILLTGMLGVANLVTEKKEANRIITPLLRTSEQLIDGEELFFRAMRAVGKKDIFTAAQDLEAALGAFSMDTHEKALLLTNLNLGICYRILGKIQEALLHLDRAIDISRANDLGIYEAKAYREKGIAYYSEGQEQNSVSAVEKALLIHQRLGDKKEELIDNLILASLLGRSSNPSGQNRIRQVMELSSELGHTGTGFEIHKNINAWEKGAYDELIRKHSTPDFENL